LKCNTRGSIGESLVRGQEVKTLARGVVVAKDTSFEPQGRERGEIGFAGEVTTEASDGVLYAAFLPGFVRVTEEGGKGEALSEEVMGGELGTVVEGEGKAQGGRQRGEPLQEVFDDGLGGLVGLAGQTQEARGTLMNHEHGLAILSKEHEISFPVAGGRAVVGLRRTIVNGDAVLDVVDGTATPLAEAAATGLMTGQETMPVILLGRAMVDETVDGLVADESRAFEVTETAGDLLGGPALLQVVTNLRPQFR
jgi:hypothetical protein